MSAPIPLESIVLHRELIGDGVLTFSMTEEGCYQVAIAVDADHVTTVTDLTSVDVRRLTRGLTRGLSMLRHLKLKGRNLRDLVTKKPA